MVVERSTHTDWMNEGGQSSSGQLLDWTLLHPAEGEMKRLAKEKGIHWFTWINQYLVQLAQQEGAPFVSALSRNFHVYPDMHGNRSPLGSLLPLRVSPSLLSLR